MSVVPRAARLLIASLCLAMGASTVGAQVVPHADYRTLVTPHFRVHYTPGLDTLARRAAASAERAWVRLARELVPPRAPVDLVVADNVDYSNGFASTFPTNRVVVYAAPPVEGALRSYGDWMDLVVTHEVVHVFHLDRRRGIWRLAQYVFGRNPALFPNAYSPSWLTEGLAVYYESRLTGSGRLAGTPHRVQALATAAGGHSPRLDQLSTATPAFPGGSSAYVWGSLAVERLAQGADPRAVRRFVDATAGQVVPLFLNDAAHRAFGESFSHAWRGWRDSLAAAARALRTDTTWQVLGPAAWGAAPPRWTAGGDAVAWPASFPREVPALWLADSGGRLRRAARRNSLDVNVPRRDGSVVFAQLEFTDPFHVRSDLWVEDARGARRLTRGARLVQPDVRDDGTVVAVQFVAGTTRLVRVDAASGRVTPVTAAHPDTQWSEPRWGGARGDEIAAVRRMHGGRTDVVRLDSTGRATVLLASDRIEASPAWTGDGCGLWSVSDRGGLPQPLLAPARCTDAASDTTWVVGVLDAVPARTAGIVALDASRGDSGASRLAALGIGAGGYRLLTHDTRTLALSDTVAAEAARLEAARLALADTTGQGAAEAPSRAYSPWRGLLPTWWLPLVGETEEGTTTIGGYSSGNDVVARHLWSAQVLVPVRRPEEFEGALTWRWRGLGQPTVDLAVVQEWDRGRASIAAAGGGGARDTFRFSRADRTVSLGLSVVRPRIYSSASLSAGMEYEWYDPFRTEPSSIEQRLSPRARSRLALPGAYISTSWAMLQRAPLAVSAEDGVSIGATARQRWQGDADLADSRTAIGTLRAYKSVKLPGYARHVLAARASAAWASDASLDDFTAGGTSGSSLEVLPGVSVGDAARAFGVRGFAAGAQRGNRALGGAVEYRAPLFIANRGLGLTPLYLARTGVTLFGEGASAWCAVAGPEVVCPDGPRPRAWMASAGAELWLDASASYDVPYRVRLGVAAPVTGADVPVQSQRRRVSGYVTFGAAF